MKRLITLLAMIFSGAVAWAQPSVVVTVDTFDSRLTPYGAWLELPGYGRVWQPDFEVVGDDFYPYGSGGHWVFTDEGWVFDSEYPFGWAVFHYGRWMFDPDYGWVWVPGHTWAPAWVSWRMGGSYVGWAPMGPRGAPEFQRNRWLFVETGQLTVVNVRSHAVDERRFHAAVTITQPVHGAVPVGPPPTYVSAATRVQVRAVPVNEVRSSGRAIPPPPPPGQAAPRPPPARRIGNVPPPPGQPDRSAAPPPARVEPERRAPPPPALVEPERRAPPPARIEPERRAPPPARIEPERRAPPPARTEPERRAPPPARVEPERLRGPGLVQPPPPPPGRMEPQRAQPGAFAPPPPPPGQPQPSTNQKKKQQQGPPGPPPPPSRRAPR